MVADALPAEPGVLVGVDFRFFFAEEDASSGAGVPVPPFLAAARAAAAAFLAIDFAGGYVVGGINDKKPNEPVKRKK